MKKLSFALGILILAVFLIQCRTKKVTSTVIPKPTADKVIPVAKKRWPDIKQAELDSGYVILNTKCVRCHGSKPIASRSEQNWTMILSKMAPKAKLNEAQKQAVTRYLLAAREAGIQ